MLDPEGERYLQTWKNLLGSLAGWSEQDVMDWAERSGMLGWLADYDNILYNQTPQYWAVRHLIPDVLYDQLEPGQRVQILARLLDVLGHDDLPTNTDWGSYRPTVQEVIADYQRQIIPDALYDQLEPEERVQLLARLLDVRGDDDIPANPDWHSYRPTVQDVIAEYERRAQQRRHDDK